MHRKNLRSSVKTGKKLSDEVCEKIAEEYQEGKNVSAIAKDHKIAVGLTYKILHDYGTISEALANVAPKCSPITDNVKERNREFAEFVRMNVGKTLHDLAHVYGISYSTAVNITKSENIRRRRGVILP